MTSPSIRRTEGGLGELHSPDLEELERRDLVGTEQPADQVRGSVARLAGVDDRHVEAHPPERERRLQAGAATSDYDNFRIHGMARARIELATPRFSVVCSTN